jgi:hypothetical protein
MVSSGGEHTPASTEGRTGKRGPKPGTKYGKRVAMPRAVPISNDGQLVAAQRFNEHLDAVLGQIDMHIFPVGRIDRVLIERLYDTAEQVQSAVVEGIVEYHELHERAAGRAAGRVAGTADKTAPLPEPQGEGQEHLPCRALGPWVLGTVDECD